MTLRLAASPDHATRRNVTLAAPSASTIKDALSFATYDRSWSRQFGQKN